MKIYVTIFALLAIFAPSTVSAQDAKPNDIFIASMAQHFVTQNLGNFARASYGPAVVHPQPEAKYWAVVGRLVTDAVEGHMKSHDYVAAVRQTCDDFKNADCWQLEKMALDNKIIK